MFAKKIGVGKTDCILMAKLHKYRVLWKDGTIKFLRGSTFSLACLAYQITAEDLKRIVDWKIVAE
jgi:hypothetical protein